MNPVENIGSSAASDMTVSADSGTQPGMAAAHLEMADAGKAETQKSITQIEAEQARKHDFAAALRAARDLRRIGVRGGRTASGEYARALAALRHARARKGSIPEWLLKFCRSRGIHVESPATVADATADTWSDALNMLEKLQALSAVCDHTGIGMPVSADKDENRAEWDKVIGDLQARMEAVGAGIRTELERLQDTVGRYDSLLKSAGKSMRG